MKNILPFITFFTAISITPVYADADSLGKATPCKSQDTTCLLTNLKVMAGDIENSKWGDQTLREVAKLMTHNGQIDEALSIIQQISNPDTKAMTIRGIGMAAAEEKLSKKEYQDLFSKLRAEAEKIDHEASYAIALTYIAMSQAFAGDNAGATKTSLDMQNDSLRNKAFAETAEIQAEKGQFDEAMKSISHIDDASFRDKAYGIISDILSAQKDYENALKATDAIDNSYIKSRALLKIVAAQITPDEVSLIK